MNQSVPTLRIMGCDVFLLVTLLIMPTLSFASQSGFIQWHSTNIQLLRGGEYELGSQQRTIMTFEHANRWSYGDFYIFGDKDWRDVGDSAYYVEPTLRVSFNKLYGEKLTSGIVKDVFIAGQIEKPKGQRPRTLIGLSADLDVAGFRFFKTMLFLRDNPDLAGDTQQFTFAWNYPFSVAGIDFLTEGFADIAGSEGTSVANQLFVPRLLIDIGQASGWHANTLWLGIEWQYWHNKFGVKGVTESVPQLQVKYVF